MMLWKIYYDDGTTFSEDDGPIFRAPGWGVQAVVQTDETVGREILQRYDYYLFEGHRWSGINVDGLDDQLLNVGIGRRCIKKGRAIDRDVFRLIYARAMSDPDFPRKSARLPSERGVPA